MSYAFGRGFADFSEWSCISCHLFTTGGVYVLRLLIAGADLTSPRDAMLFARALGQGNDHALVVRGVAVSPGGSPDQSMVDIVSTANYVAFSIPLASDDAAAMAKNVATEPTIARTFPNLRVLSAAFGELTGPKDAVDHWLSQPPLWDPTATGKNGNVTASFADPAPYSIVHGKADDGARAVPWTIQKPALGPASPPSPSPPATNPATILFVAAAIGTVYFFTRKKIHGRRLAA